MTEYGINLKEDMILENRRSLARALRSRQRRIRQLRRRGSILVLCLLLSFLFLTGFRHKSPVILPAGGEIYTPVRVERGDTLWDLAGVYMPDKFICIHMDTVLKYTLFRLYCKRDDRNMQFPDH